MRKILAVVVLAFMASGGYAADRRTESGEARALCVEGMRMMDPRLSDEDIRFTCDNNSRRPIYWRCVLNGLSDGEEKAYVLHNCSVAHP